MKGTRPLPPVAKGRDRTAEPARVVSPEVLADQRRRLLGKHYLNKYRVRRGG